MSREKRLHIDKIKAKSRLEREMVSICVNSDALYESLAELLSESYQIERVRDGVINGHLVDIHIVDEHHFETNKEHLLELKELVMPEIMPVMLVCEGRERSTENPDVLEVVDDVIDPSLNKEFMSKRIELLLEHRRMSKRLNQSEHLKKGRKCKLNKETDFLYYVADRLPGVFYMLNEDLDFIYWNHNYVNDLGYSEEEIRALSPYDLFDDEGKAKLRSAIQEVYETGNAEITAPLITKDGSIRHFFINGAKIKRDGELYIVGSGIDITEQVQAQQDYLQQKKLMEAIINQSSSLIYAKDRDGRYQVVNKAFLEVFGLKSDDVIGKTQKDIFGDNYLKRSDCNKKNVLSSDEGSEYEEEVEVNGERICFQTSNFPLKGVPGFEQSVCEISTDITQRKNLQLILEERNKEKNCLIEISNALDSIYEDDRVLDEVVDLIALGFPCPENMSISVHYGDLEVLSNHRSLDGTSLKSNTLSVAEKPLQIKVVIGNEIVDQKGQAFLDGKIDLLNRIAKVIATKLGKLDDIRRLHESEKRWENLVKNDPDLVMIVEGEEIMFINNAGAKMYGSQPEELVRKNLFQLIHIEDSEKAKKRLKAVSNGEEVEPFVHNITHPHTGETKYLRIQSVPIPYNSRIAVQIVGTDMTSNIESENRLKEMVREKNVLLQEIHHRVKNNLAVVSGLLELQVMESEDEKLSEALSDSVSRIKTMALVHEKLYSQDSLSDINFEDYIEDLTKDILMTHQDRRNVQLKLDIEPIVLNVNQAVPCAMILNELVTNSFKHAFDCEENGEVRVSIREKDGRVYAEVHDNGKGIDPDFLYQNKSMGVTILNTLIDQLDAEIIAENRDGAYIAFNFKRGKLKGAYSNLDS